MPSRPRAVLAAGFILLMCALCVRLGFWQLGRLEQRRARNAVATRGLSAPPARLDDRTMGAIRGDPSGWVYRRVTATGEFDPAGVVLLRGRSDAGRPGVHVVVPLRLDDALLLVNRGWVPAPDGARPAEPVPTPAGPVSVAGILMEVPRTGDRGAPAGNASFRRLDLAVMRDRHGPALLPLYLQVTEGEGLPRPVPPPALDEGPHRAYAVQWFGFAATGFIGLLVLVLRGRRERPDPA